MIFDPRIGIRASASGYEPLDRYSATEGRGNHRGTWQAVKRKLLVAVRYGLTFWFRWKTLSGSYRRLTSRNRFQFGPSAADTALLSAASSAFR